MYRKILKHINTLHKTQQEFVDALYKAEIKNSAKQRFPHFIFSVDNPANEPSIKATHEQVLTALKNKGYNAEEITGKYGGKNERSIIVHNPPEHGLNSLYGLVTKLGQESSIYSNGLNHEMHFHNGPHAGSHIKGKDTNFHKELPNDNYSSMKDGTIFSHNFNWNNKFDHNTSMLADKITAPETSANTLNYKKINKLPQQSEANTKTLDYGKINKPAPESPDTPTIDYSKFNKSEMDMPSPIPEKYDEEIRGIANSYAKTKGITLNHSSEATPVNPDKAKQIADAYHKMPHTPNHPETKAAYNALIQETSDQFQHIKDNTGMKFSKMKPGMENPYKTSKDLLNDVKNNKHMWYFPTEQGFGSTNEQVNHPMLQETSHKHEDGSPMLANDVFRIVHDYFGHVKEGNGFGPNGEEKAWQIHKQMYSPAAQKALTTETRGQNSWVNLGPHGESNRADPKNTIYADQKAGLLPDWAHDHGNMNKSEMNLAKSLATKEGRVKKLLEHAEKAHPLENQNPLTNLIHYSKEGGIKELDPNFHGIRGIGAEAKRGQPENPTTFYYLEGTKPEHIVTSGTKYKYTTQLGNKRVYDIGKDPEEIRQKLRSGEIPTNNEGIFTRDELDRAIRNHGYHGIYNSSLNDTMKNVVAMYDRMPVDKQMNIHPNDFKEASATDHHEEDRKLANAKQFAEENGGDYNFLNNLTKDKDNE